MNHNSILFDIGATKTRMAYTENGEYFEEPVVYETPQNYEEAFRTFANKGRELAKNREIKSVVGGASRSISGFDLAKFKNDLEREFGARVVVDNDSAMVGLGEANYGAGRGSEIVAYVTVSTGVGGARIVGGKIDERAVGFEPGKQIVDIDSGKNLEEMISGKAVAAEMGRPAKEVTDPEFWDKKAETLAVGLNNIIVEWSPNCVVLGGSMITGSPAIPLDKTEVRLKEILKIFPEVPPVKKSELGDFGGLYGALAYLKDLK